MNLLRDRIRLVLDELKTEGVDQITLAKAAGVSKGAVSQWLSGDIKSLKLKYAQGIQKAYGYDVNWLVLGVGNPRGGGGSASPGRRDAASAPQAQPWPLPGVPESTIRSLPDDKRAHLEGAILLALGQLGIKAPGATGGYAVPTKVPLQGVIKAVENGAANDPDYVALPLKKIKIRAGVAGFSLDQTGNGTAGAVYVSRAWLTKRGINPEVAFASHVGGMSMWPRVQEGDVVVVNPGDTERRNGIVYAFNHDGEFVLKRLKKQLNRWYLTSDNPDKTQFPPVHADEGTFMIGRAVLLQAEEI